MANSSKLLQRITLAALGGLPPIFLSLLLLRIWIDPLSVDNGGWVKLAASLIILEFLLLHSGAFMAVGPIVCPRRWQRLGWFLGFGIFYAAAIIAYDHWSHGNYVKWLLFAIVTSRLLTLVILRDKQGTIMILQRSTFGVVLLLLTAVIVFMPLPSLGITEEVRGLAFGSADDMLARYPQRTIAWGVAYFLLMGVFEMYLGWFLPDWRKEDIEKTWGALKK